MSILRDFERRLSGAVEGFFARVFRSGLQPVELAKALQRYAGDYQQVGVSGVTVPNRYRFDLSHDDRERFAGYDASLERELADVVRRTASERGWSLQGPVRIELRASDQVREGTYELRGRVQAEERPEPEPEQHAARPQPAERPASPAPAAAPQPQPAAPQPQPQPANEDRTMVVRATETPSLHLLNGPNPGQRIELEGTTLVGRLPECDVQLSDTSVSRRHARLVQRPGGWSIEDLESTNGVRVNGTDISQTTLSAGDTIELGSVRMTFSLDA